MKLVKIQNSLISSGLQKRLLIFVKTFLSLTEEEFISLTFNCLTPENCGYL